MEDEFVYLTISQGFTLASQIVELKKNPYFRDDIAESFMGEVYAQAANITVSGLNFKSNLAKKLQKNGDKIKVSRSKFEYVTRLTGLDVFDEEAMAEYRNSVFDSSIQNSSPRGRK